MRCFWMARDDAKEIWASPNGNFAAHQSRFQWTTTSLPSSECTRVSSVRPFRTALAKKVKHWWSLYSTWHRSDWKFPRKHSQHLSFSHVVFSTPSLRAVNLPWIWLKHGNNHVHSTMLPSLPPRNVANVVLLLIYPIVRRQMWSLPLSRPLLVQRRHGYPLEKSKSKATAPPFPSLAFL